MLVCNVCMQPMRRSAVDVESTLLSMPTDRMLAVNSACIIGARRGRNAVSLSTISVTAFGKNFIVGYLSGQMIYDQV